MPKPKAITTAASVAASTVLHAALLIVLGLIVTKAITEEEEVVVESILNEERIVEEYNQDMTEEMEVSENLNTQSGGVVSANVGATSQPVAAARNVEITDLLEEPDLQVNRVGDTRPSDSEIGVELDGTGAITGDIGAAVEGYGAALDRMVRELRRMMRKEKIMAVWLFDRSDSMKDDQKDIAAKFGKIYEELQIVQKKDEKIKSRLQDQPLQTVIAAYGNSFAELTKEPTNDIKKVQEAIGKITVDESGDENMCAAIQGMIDKYARRVLRDKRRLVIIVVSDESGTDGQHVDETIAKAKKVKAPIYVMGRESIFGYPYSRIRYQDPKYKLWHWLRIDRGPETAFPECLQWDGLHARWDSFTAGFGPYEQVRFAKETGGIFFVLPGEEENLAGAGANEKRKFEFLDMKRYTPLLLPRRVYAEERDKSKFRKQIWDVIVRLNPTKNQFIPAYDNQLNIRQHRYPLSNAEFRAQAAKEAVKAKRAMDLLNIAIDLLEKVRGLRDSESFDRWRANYDLLFAQCVAYRVRLFQYLLAMDGHANDMPEPTKKNSNRWDVRRTRAMIVPDEPQFERLKKAFNVKMNREEYLAYVQAEEKRAVGLYDEVIKSHPGTPWSDRAQYELRQGFGMHFYDSFWDPKYDKLDIKLPKQ